MHANLQKDKGTTAEAGLAKRHGRMAHQLAASNDLQDIALKSDRVNQLKNLQDIGNQASRAERAAQLRAVAANPHPTPINDDKGLEREADIMGDKAVQMAAAPAAQSAQARPAADANGPGVIQRYLIVGGDDYTRWYREMADTHTGVDKDTATANDLDTKITQIAVAMLQELDTNDPYEAKIVTAAQNDPGGKLRRQIAKWIEDKPGDTSSPKSHPDFGRKNQPRVYANLKDMAYGLYGWVSGKANRREEKAKAADVQSNEAISYHLDSVLRKIAAWNAGHLSGGQIATDLANPTTAVSGHRWDIYQNYFAHAGKGAGTQLPGSYTDVLANPQNYDVRQKTGILHDLMHYYMEKYKANNAINLVGGLPNFQATVLDGMGSKRVDYDRPKNSQIRHDKLDGRQLVKPIHMPGNLDAVDVSNEETHDSYKFARSKDIPMYGRHSFSAARMINMAHVSGATKEEKSAVAWSIMSYWRKNYDHTSLPYHTLHEVMDLTPAYGLDYNPDDRYAGLKAFTPQQFIKTLQRDILAHPNTRDIQKLMAKDTQTNVAAFFLAHQALWHDATVWHFLTTTVLPESEFLKLKSSDLQTFFNYNNQTKAILPHLSLARRNHVEGVVAINLF